MVEVNKKSLSYCGNTTKMMKKFSTKAKYSNLDLILIFNWSKFLIINSIFAIRNKRCPSAGIGRQAWLRAMCPYGREGSTPSLGTLAHPFDSGSFQFPLANRTN